MTHTSGIPGTGSDEQVAVHPAATPAQRAGEVAITLALVFAIGLLTSSAAWATPRTPTVTISCHAKSPGNVVAPTVCRFDGNGSTDTDVDVRPFHDWRWDWNFGDGTAGVHYNGKSKNSDTGRRQHTAHVYWAAGAYPWSLTVTGPTGATASFSGTLNIGSNDSGWSGANTKCVSASGNFAGCPSGAAQVTTADFNVGLDAAQRAAGKRTLFRCGEQFNMNSAYNAPSSFANATGNSSFIGTFNSNGAQTSAGCTAAIRTTPVSVLFDTANMDGWRLVNLVMTNASQGSGTNPMPFFNGGTTMSGDFMVLGGSVNAMSACLLNNAGSGSAQDDFVTFAEWACSADDRSGRAEWPLGHFEHEDLTLLDTVWTLNSGVMKGQRFQGGTGLYHAYSQFNCPVASGCTIQLRGSHTPGRVSQRSIIADLSIYDNSSEGSRNFAICPSDDCAGEAPNSHTNVAIENTLVRYGPQTRGSLQQVFQLAGSDVTLASSIIDTRGIDASTNFRICNSSDGPGAAPASGRIDCLSNTVISNAPNGELPIIVCDGGAGTGNRCRNNLVHNMVATSGGGFGSGGPWTRSNNEDTYGAAECPFTGNGSGNCTLSAPGQSWNPAEAKLRASGGGRALVVDRGMVWPDNAPDRRQYRDFFGGCIGTGTGGPDGTPDIGAAEFGSIVCGAGGGTPPPAALAPPTLLAPR